MGYKALASLMGKAPEVAIFRRFSVLNARNLLYLQAELVQLEDDLQSQLDQLAQLDKCDKKQGCSPQCLHHLYDRNLDDLRTARNGGDDKTPWQIFEEIRAKLKDYNDALNMQITASGFGKPHKHDLNFLKEMLDSDVNLCLLGSDSKVWESADDLIALKARPKLDFLSNLFIDGDMQDKILKFWNMVKRRFMKENDILPTSISNDSFEGKYINFEDKKLYRIANIITTVISSMLPITSVIILYFVDNMRARLGIVAALMALFSLTLALVTEAKRVEIFAATAGFAAVLVIFVGSSSLSS